MYLLYLPSIADLQPYFTTIAVLVNLATLGFVVNLANLMRSVKDDQIKALEARNKAVQDEAEARMKLLEERTHILETQAKGARDDLDRTEKWHNRKVEELTQEMDKYKNQLKDSLTDAGINLETLVLGRSVSNLADEIKQTVEKTVLEMQGTFKELRQTGESGELIKPDWYLELGMGFMATGEWGKAAKEFDKYVQREPLNWEVHFSRAVSHANTRGGGETDLLALRAYNEAIALAPEDIDINLKARLFAYRAAILKRLNRLGEAEADLEIASQVATREYEMGDIQYNLACVYALKGDRTKLMSILASMKRNKSYQEFAAIQGHLHDYFAAFANDKEFMNAIST